MAAAPVLLGPARGGVTHLFVDGAGIAWRGHRHLWSAAVYSSLNAESDT